MTIGRVYIICELIIKQSKVGVLFGTFLSLLLKMYIKTFRANRCPVILLDLLVDPAIAYLALRIRGPLIPRAGSCTSAYVLFRRWNGAIICTIRTSNRSFPDNSFGARNDSVGKRSNSVEGFRREAIVKSTLQRTRDLPFAPRCLLIPTPST